MGFRVSRKDFIIPRCTAACPAGVDVPRYVRAVRDGLFDEAIAVLREHLPLPTICADACFAPCEDVCAYKQFGDPIAIRAMKRAAVDQGGDTWLKNKKQALPSGKKVAIIGAGPAGLTAAYYLATLGHQVTLLDAFPKPGGTTRYGIPKYRLPDERLDKDINAILDLGVTFQGNTVVGKDVTLEELKRDYDAVFIALGANASAKIPIEGADKKGVYWGLDFLRDVALSKKVLVGSEVAVIGGGNVAIDVALAAHRLGAKKISLFCLENREEMPAHPYEITLAEEEGIVIKNQWAPVKILGTDKVAGVKLKRCLSAFDKTGKFNPAYDEETTEKVSADTVILAIGQTPELDFVEKAQVNLNGNRVVVCENRLSTSVQGIFAGGDVVTGPASIISAIAQGRKAAAAIDKYLGGRGDISETLAAPEDSVELEEFIPIVQPRHDLPHLKAWERALDFEHVELPMADRDIKAEASRCLNCDARKFEVVLEREHCKECGYCAEVCGIGTFVPAAGYTQKGYRPMEVKSSDHCVSCFKCFFVCPDFAIDVREIVKEIAS
ncbi:MAG: FAD-dependent oxidoreductase [Deltaproteobacteria bacterium]|nr:MAG: FAD-dependent oxidoreductase [Deltaproteobacteria bacterium]